MKAWTSQQPFNVFVFFALHFATSTTGIKSEVLYYITHLVGKLRIYCRRLYGVA